MHEQIAEEVEEVEQELDLTATFKFPENLTEHYALGKHLIIAAEQANWLVCGDEEYEVFSLFRAGKSIREVESLVLEEHRMDSGQVRAVVSRLIAQILGKEFMRQAAVSEKGTFKSANLRITSGCNLRCATCWLRATVAEPDECSYDDWRRFLRAFASVGGELVTITGGEPMTRGDCLRIIQYANEVGFNVILLTNGTLINKENAKILNEYCGEIQVSIDGPDAETHDSVRGKGTFERAIAGLKELSIYPSYHLSIAMTPTLATLPVFQTNLRQFTEWVWQNIDPDISFRMTRNLWGGRHIAPMSEEEEIAHTKNIDALCNDQLEAGFTDKLDAIAVVPNRRVSGCGLGALFTVASNGDMRVCIYQPDPFGNIKDIGEDDTLFHDIAHKVREMGDSLRVEELPTCRECDLRYFCGGKCRGENRRDHGCPKTCGCEDEWRQSWYERLVRISPYIVQPC